MAAMIVLAFGVAGVRGEALGSSWIGSTAYPGPGIELQSCVPNADFLQFYCIGGFGGTSVLNTVYADSISVVTPTMVTSTSTKTTTVPSSQTVTVTSTVTSYTGGNQSGGSTVTSTKTVSTLTLSNTTLTKTAFSFSVTTTTVTSTTTSLTGSTTVLTTITQSQQVSSPIELIGIAVAGVVLGALVAAVAFRTRPPKSNASDAKESGSKPEAKSA